MVVDSCDKYNHLGEVFHIEYGTGLVIGVNKGKIKVYFDDSTRVFDFPDVFDTFELISDDSRITRMLEMDAKGFNVKNILMKEKIDILKSHYPQRKCCKARPKSCKKRYGNGLYGNGVQDINFDKPENFVKALAYIATNCSLEALVPDDRTSVFEEMYPNQHYATVKLEQKGSTQFRLELKHPELAPVELLNNSCIVRNTYNVNDIVKVCRTGFVADLVDNRGFVFGSKQNIDEIYNRVPNEFKELFEDTVLQFMCL